VAKSARANSCGRSADTASRHTSRVPREPTTARGAASFDFHDGRAAHHQGPAVRRVRAAPRSPIERCGPDRCGKYLSRLDAERSDAAERQADAAIFDAMRSIAKQRIRAERPKHAIDVKPVACDAPAPIGGRNEQIDDDHFREDDEQRQRQQQRSVAMLRIRESGRQRAPKTAEGEA